MNWWSTFTPQLWEAMWLTVRLAAVTTFILLILGVPLANWLNQSRRPWTRIIQTLVSLPIVLPPTVIGFYLLVLFSPTHLLGEIWVKCMGHGLAFSFTGLVIGSVLYSLPFAVQPFRAALKSVPVIYIEASYALGAKSFEVFRRVRIPMARRGIVIGAALAFAHTMGEFGVVLMIGGNIPGKTRVASIALYDAVQNLNFTEAHTYAVILVLTSLLFLVLISFLEGSEKEF